MKKKVALIFGHKGGIGFATREAFYNSGYRIIPVDRTVIDFTKPDADQDIDSLLTNSRPDVTVNCTGIFENGHAVTHHQTMNINFGSNWSIIRHYMNPKNQDYETRIIMLGSSSYTGGRKLYPLYSASKAALYNLWQSASETMEGTHINIDLINPVRTLTKMSTAGKQIDPNLDYLQPAQVATKILTLVKENLTSRCIDMTFEDAK